MPITWIPKAVLGGSVFAGTSVGVGSVMLTSPKSGNYKTTTRKGCRIHKLMSSSAGTFERIEEDELEQEILGLKQGNYFKQIKDSCDKLKDKDIFVSNKDNTGWKYYEEDQTKTNGTGNVNFKQIFENYLNGLKRK
ncbi:hypothetical protein HF1_05680 [Mycoplasma haemofelis str. Langford 1]|uniref:Initiator Rep protein WH1 domain-containing protein n=1 Tax=Mycoplasma haemofelis (strain Langford 1) TaxID=941640 RepID=E8ZHF5_MYCHL|nr:RepB family plasmid replication initiator protein [Mycoplasma haemofelis]CBY92576.1 hypothetical protein HF1_05680 [Mycoplasma haemofelis str. Langford 1]